MFWLGAAVSLCFIPGYTGAYIATQWPVLAVLLSFGLLRRGPLTAFHGLGLIFVVYAIIRVWYSPVPQLSVFGIWLVWIMALSLWFGTILTDVRGLYAGLAIGGAVSSIVAMFQYAGFHWPETVVAIRDGVASPMVAGIYVNSVQQGLVLALIIVALTSERMWRWMPALLPGLILSGSRGAWLALAVGLIGCYVRRVWLFGIVGAAGVFFLLMPLSLSDQIRVAIWNAAWQHLTLFGWGPGTFYVTLFPQTNGSVLFPEYAHNDALQLAFEYGIGALPLFAVFAMASQRTGAREWPVVLAFVTAGCYSMPLWMPVASFLGLVAVGRVLRDYGLSRGYRSDGGSALVSWAGCEGREVVSVAPHYRAEG